MRWRVALWSFAVMLGFMTGPGLTREDVPRPGLMWQKTGLPAVFPLIVRSNPGEDYYMTLHVSETGDAVLAAYVSGGAFFKVLVPPGTYAVQFAAGLEWMGEEALFGAETRRFVLPAPLTFEVRDFSTKGGHMIDLRDPATPVIEARAICQRYALESIPRPQPEYRTAQAHRADPVARDILSPFSSDAIADTRLRRAEEPAIPTNFAPYFSNPAYAVRTRLCH